MSSLLFHKPLSPDSCHIESQHALILAECFLIDFHVKDVTRGHGWMIGDHLMMRMINDHLFPLFLLSFHMFSVILHYYLNFSTTGYQDGLSNVGRLHHMLGSSPNRRPLLTILSFLCGRCCK